MSILRKITHVASEVGRQLVKGSGSPVPKDQLPGLSNWSTFAGGGYSTVFEGRKYSIEPKHRLDHHRRSGGWSLSVTPGPGAGLHAWIHPNGEVYGFGHMFNFRTPQAAVVVARIWTRRTGPEPHGIMKAWAEREGKTYTGRVRAVEDERPYVRWEVIVGNVGTVFDGTREAAARVEYKNYVILSKSGNGRAGGESVTLMKNGEPVDEHFGANGSVDETRRRPAMHAASMRPLREHPYPPPRRPGPRPLPRRR